MNPHAKMRDAPKGGNKDPIWEQGYDDQGRLPGPGGGAVEETRKREQRPRPYLPCREYWCGFATWTLRSSLLVGLWAAASPGSMGE